VPHSEPEPEAVVVGAGFAGLYTLLRLRQAGVPAVVLEAADDVGGTWYWNRYPGARCDIATSDYQYSFDPALEAEWRWSERYATQPEILRYLQFVADRYDLPDQIRFGTSVAAAAWDEATSTWQITTGAGDTLRCRWFVMATGCLSVPKEIDVPGAERFAGATYATGRWPHEDVDFAGQRVAVVGTGSSAIQAIPLIAEQAAELVVFQRTPNFSIPARIEVPPDRAEWRRNDRAGYLQAMRDSAGGVPQERPTEMAAQLTADEHRRRFEAAYATGEMIPLLSLWADQLANPTANEIVAEFVREKVAERLGDPELTESMLPRTYPIGAKRLCLDTNYYETFRLPHVRLVDLRRDPITTVTEAGIDTARESFEFDAIVWATGFDAMTGAVVAVDITGHDGLTLEHKWEHGPRTYLGLTVAGFPNLFLITGPGSPSALSNMVVSIEQHADWVADRIAELSAAGYDRIEPTQQAEDGWVQHVNDYADITLMPRANSWYMGANVPGKPRVFLPYVGGVDRYRHTCDEVVARGMIGFDLSGPGVRQCNDGVIRELQPDVTLLLEMLVEMGLPPMETLPPAAARELMATMSAVRPPGPEVGEVIDGTLPGADGTALAWRLYRPATPGPHPLMVWFHGGGWVLGDVASDEPVCRDLCVRSGVAVVSVDYRHAPEVRFPAAADDALAAVEWWAEHAAEHGCRPDALVVGGWSAGGNLATVAARRFAGNLAGQVLLTPVTDCDFDRPSYTENADGYVLTAPLMHWFWDHYCDPADRADPRASPFRADDLSGLPPAVIVTCQFDPLRDEGGAYAAALAEAGVPVTHIEARGHTHTSLTMVDVIPSGAQHRQALAEAIANLFAVAVP
jgi:cation diffusion facilitator CzcD-associated flavoprotein CzcO/acetyl esterase/lipase